MTTDPGAKPHCALCGSREHEHIRRGESCAERLVGQRDLAEGLAIAAGSALVGLILAYISVVAMFFK
jgi:hypothetical protein